MAPPGTLQTLLSPAELDFLSVSLGQKPPIRPDLRTPRQFRPLVAETDILPSTNGSARVCFSDGTEAIAGIKAELKKTTPDETSTLKSTNDEGDTKDGAQAGMPSKNGKGSNNWLEMSIEIPGLRDDDALPVFLSAMLTEALLAGGSVRDQLWINERWHWKLYIDILSLSPPLSYPLPLLSLTTHLALLRTALPKLISEPEDDPLFDDDWAAAMPLFPKGKFGSYINRPPITLLVMTVGENVIFDPTKEELAVAENVVAASIVSRTSSSATNGQSTLELVAIRTIDPPSRLTPTGTPNVMNLTTLPGFKHTEQHPTQDKGTETARGSVWNPPRGGLRRSLLANIITNVLQSDGVGAEMLDSLAAVKG